MLVPRSQGPTDHSDGSIPPNGGVTAQRILLPDEIAQVGPEGDLKQSVGFSVSDVDRQLADRFELDRWTNGVAITDIDPHSNAGQAGLRQGDLIPPLAGK